MQAVEAAKHRHLTPQMEKRLRAGEISVEPAGEMNPRRVPSGLIHDWIGLAFIPSARIDDVISVVRNYAAYGDVYKPSVLSATLGRRNGDRDQFSVTFRIGAYLKKTAIECEYESSYSRVNEATWYSDSRMVETREIDDYKRGEPGGNCPSIKATVHLWRLNRITWYEQRDGGVCLDSQPSH